MNATSFCKLIVNRKMGWLFLGFLVCLYPKSVGGQQAVTEAKPSGSANKFHQEVITPSNRQVGEESEELSDRPTGSLADSVEDSVDKVVGAVDPSTKNRDGLDFFERHIRPLLIEACAECHSGDELSGGLSVESLSDLLRGGDHGPAINLEQPEQSRMIIAVSRVGDLKMPPGKSLKASHVDQLREWVRLGAPWPASSDLMAGDGEKRSGQSSSGSEIHWAFEPFGAEGRSKVETIGLKDNPWCSNGIDQFILRKLKQVGLEPSPRADRRTLIRRVTFDLTGLPPTMQEVEAFLQDSSDGAWETVVDRLLESPSYGEKWARHWMDLARYSDSKGYVYAREERFWVHAWVYRDWVIEAFNQDMPYDRFLRLQIAGDHFAENPQELSAMGFLTLGRRFLGVQHDIIDDRIDVVTRATMGLSVACARCHDHKFDPVTIEDYYSLYGIFRNSSERLVPVVGQEDVDQQFAEGLAERLGKLNETLKRHRMSASHRVRERVGEYLEAQLHLDDYPEAGFDQIYVESDIIPEFVRRWRDFLDLQGGEKDLVFEPWRRFRELKIEQFSELAVGVCEEIDRDSGVSVDPRVAACFHESPSTMLEVVERYAKLFADSLEAWKDSPNEDLKKDSLWGVLFGDEGPCVVPDESIVTLERFFPTSQTEELWKLQAEVDRWIMNAPNAPPYVLALFDKQSAIVDSHVMHRGDPKLLGERVPRSFLSAFQQFDQNNPAVVNRYQNGSGRKELAEAITSPMNPLTARVAVNRIWKHHFAEGLVPTLSDFGLRAGSPTHLELLNWLAMEFVEGGWKQKNLHRLIVLSSTYQQSSQLPEGQTSGDGQSVDPENRLVWRYPPRRLSFEALRDAMLSVSGELDHSVGGRPGEMLDSKRRTVYSKVDRQFFSTTMRSFDVASPDLHISKRSETTVPQQALFFLNHPFVLSRVSALLKRLDHQAASNVEKIQELYRLVFQRLPDQRELDLALNFLSHGDRYLDVEPVDGSVQWSYGYGAYNAESQRVMGFQALPYFDGQAWQGGASYPDSELGWVQLNASGGHPGNVVSQASIRRWTAPAEMRIRIESELIHEPEVGDGIHACIVSSRAGKMVEAEVHHESVRMAVESIQVEKGETIDFLVDIYGNLNSDQYLWSPTITRSQEDQDEISLRWDAVSDFRGRVNEMDPWHALAQVLISSNEFVFLD